MIAAYGGTDAAGYWTQGDSFEMLEHGLALGLRNRRYPLAELAQIHAAVTIKRSLVNGNRCVAIVGAPADQLPWLKSLGCFAQSIQYRTRVFVPAADSAAMLARILKTT